MNFRFKIQIQESGGKLRWADADKVFAHLMERYMKKQDKFQDNFEGRLEKFREEVYGFSNDYDEEMLEEFIDHFTEPNKSGTKMLFELGKTWSLGMRLKRWKRNSFGKKPKGAKKHYNFEKRDGTNFYGFCGECGGGDFYEPYSFKPGITESRCCNVLLLDKLSGR